ALRLGRQRGGDPEGYRFFWYVNDTLELREPTGQGARLRSSLTGASFDKGDVVTCRVVTFDGTNVSGNPTDPNNPGLVWSASVTIADACWSVSQVLVAPSEGRNAPTSTFRCDILGFTGPGRGRPAQPAEPSSTAGSRPRTRTPRWARPCWARAGWRSRRRPSPATCSCRTRTTASGAPRSTTAPARTRLL
ncbi:MAG: hypothetical protein M5U09_30455, partial [Gammaproteobacteria bacterium]|nr:hypothetical protein [Gammaproteobacteria bacterium]